MVTDRNGVPVTVGTRVRVLAITPSLERDLPADEWQDLKTMVGEVFEVYEIDEYGGGVGGEGLEGRRRGAPLP